VSITVLLADDHPIVRQGMRHLLEGEQDFRVVGDAEDGLKAVQMAERLKPNVLIVDMMMPGLNGLEVLRQVRQRLPQILVIVLSMQSADPYVTEALHAGASGYVLKDSGPDEVIDAVRQVVKGHRYLSPKLSERLIEAYVRKADHMPGDPYQALTDREREILQLTAEGNTSQQIAVKLSISPRTAELHRQNMMKKLALHSQTDVIRYAIKRGILPLED
jgi:DNA-binding NarL/FixJ family response regulator